MISKLSMASVSDIHVGHRKTPTAHIINNLRRMFPDTEATGELDLILVGGDLFDGPLAHYSEEAVLVQLWMFDFLKMCAKRDIVVRILEGTRSHDWKQNVWFNVVRAISGLDIDIKYVPELSIEYIERFDIHVLYVPDEWRPETDETWMEVKELMANQGIEQVDFVNLHGAFDKQLPEHVDCPKHSAERYSQITRHRVLSGHIHKSWSYLNILGNGSFDRLTHGEEEAKGYWRLDYLNGAEKVRFIENKNAMVYRTIVCDGLEIEEALDRIERIIAELPDGSHVRVQAKVEDTVAHSLDQLKKKHRQIVWSIKTSDSKVSQAKLLVDHRPVSRHIPITPQNIRQLLVEKLQAQNTTPELLKECQQMLTELGLS